MDIYLPAALEAWVHESVQSGRYESVDAVVHEALRLVEERDARFYNRHTELRHEIEVGLQQLKQGQAMTYDDQSLKNGLDSIKTEGRVERAKKQIG